MNLFIEHPFFKLMGRTTLFFGVNKVYIHMVIWNFYAFRVKGFFDGLSDFKARIPVFVGERPDS